jgi:hypothetical protein
LNRGVNFGNVPGNPASSVVAFAQAGTNKIYLSDLDHPATPPVNIGLNSALKVQAWQWSPDGQFIGIVDEPSSSYSMRSMPVNGTSASSAVSLSASSSTLIYPIWQPQH